MYYQITNNYVNMYQLSEWLLSNNLLLISSKSTLLNIPYNYHHFPHVIIDDFPIILSSSVLNIGITLNANLSLNSHIANISKSANYNILQIRRIRKDLTRPLSTVLIKVLVFSRIDYCSSLLNHITNTSVFSLNHIIRSFIPVVPDLMVMTHIWVIRFFVCVMSQFLKNIYLYIYIYIIVYIIRL